MKKLGLLFAIPMAMSINVGGCAMEQGESVESAEAELHRHRTTICFVPRRHRHFEHTIRVSERAADVLLARTASYPGECVDYGDGTDLGDGEYRTFVQYDRGEPVAYGVNFDAAGLENLPSEPSDGNHCYDNNDNGVFEMNECVGGHENVLYLPDSAIDDPDIPFSWVLLNWNPHGHAPAGVYEGYPHFDFHFYILDLETRNQIGEGPCALQIDCDDFVTATQPIPAQYMPEGYTDVGAAEAAMGNHLVNLDSHEFQPDGTFTKTWIYGAWDGDIAFYEPMITRHWILRQPENECTEVLLPDAWAIAGWYPTEYCIRYRENRDDYTVTLEGMVYREAT